MLVSLKWLNELVEVDLPVDELVDRLDMTGTAVESVKTLGDALDGIVVGRIITKDRHPDAETLWVTTVDVGEGEPLTIVCGAQNFEAGDKVPVALIGSTLPGGMKIKKAKLRGVVSHGMNCSAAELGLGDDQSGLMILPSDAPVGELFAAYQGLSDTVLELEVTPNRPDCLSMAGVAREVGAVLGKEATLPAGSPPETGGDVADSVSVHVDDAHLCPRYTARLIRGVRIGPSPAWLTEKIIAAGARPVNNIVDVTNYVMFELGQPLHAFDAAKLARAEDGRVEIRVRPALAGETLETLDGQMRELTEDMLVIADGNGAVALAGVMGGADTEVSDETVDVLLESACFDPASISLTSRALGLISESSMRFERGVDRTGCIAASNRAAQLIAEVAGGTVDRGIVDAYPRPHETTRLRLDVDAMNAVLGSEIPAQDARRILASLGCEVSGDARRVDVAVPPFRPDIEREIDLVEEVLRVWGMDRVEPTLPAGRGHVGGMSREQRLRERIGQTLRAAGLNETMTYAFVDPKDVDRIGWALGPGEHVVELVNPMSSEQSVLRRSLLPGLLRSVSYNQRRSIPDVHLYEMGAVFLATEAEKQPDERVMASGVLAGSWSPPSWNDPRPTDNSPAHLDFFDGKGVIETLADALGIGQLSVRPADVPWLQPGRRAEVVSAGEVLGWLGEVHPEVLAKYECDAPVTAFELDTGALMRRASDARGYTEIPRFPAVTLDVALVVPEDVTAERILQTVRSAGGKLLESARIFDVYRGQGIEEGHKSIAVALTYRGADRTLVGDEVDAAHARLLRKVAGALGASLRS